MCPSAHPPHPSWCHAFNVARSSSLVNNLGARFPRLTSSAKGSPIGSRHDVSPGDPVEEHHHHKVVSPVCTHTVHSDVSLFVHVMKWNISICVYSSRFYNILISTLPPHPLPFWPSLPPSLPLLPLPSPSLPLPALPHAAPCQSEVPP